MLLPLFRLRIAEYEARLGRKVEHQEVAEKLNVTKQLFSSWVNGKVHPRADKLFEIARVLGCKVDDLYEYRED